MDRAKPAADQTGWAQASPNGSRGACLSLNVDRSLTVAAPSDHRRPQSRARQ